MEGSLLVSVMNTLSTAGDDKDTGSTAVSPTFNEMADSTICPGGFVTVVTVTLALAGPYPGAVAVIVAEPAAMPETGTGELVVFSPIVTVPGTVATAGSLEVSVTGSPPAGAGFASVSVRV
jgi:hypothetical protein